MMSPKGEVILLVEDQGSGHRYFFAGVFVEEFCTGSLVAIDVLRSMEPLP